MPTNKYVAEQIRSSMRVLCTSLEQGGGSIRSRGAESANPKFRSYFILLRDYVSALYQDLAPEPDDERMITWANQELRINPDQFDSVVERLYEHAAQRLNKRI